MASVTSNSTISEGFKSVLGRLISNQSGSLMPAVAAALIGTLSFMGLAIDGARLFYAKDVLQKSLDAASLAAGNALTEDDMLADAEAFFTANVNLAGSVASNSQISLTTGVDGDVLILSATTEVDATFARIMGFETFALSASTEVRRTVRGMELALVMDNTGSMGSSKMAAMKAAATDLVNIVYGDQENNDNLFVSLVPYVANVNIGPANSSFLNSAGQSFVTSGAYATDGWAGCVMARDNGDDQTDAPPSIKAFEPFFWADDVDNNWIIEEDGEIEYDINTTRSNSRRGPNNGCGPALTPLIQSKTQVLDAIDEMNSWSRGGTASNLGLVWGWRTISPRWRGLWAEADNSGEMPLDYSTAFMDKVVVVLTDGNNQFYDWPGHSPNNGRGPLGSDFTAYDRLNTFGYSSLSSARNELNDRFAATCSAMKAQGIRIYAITFGGGAAAAANLYRECASDPDFYFHAPGNGDLADVFEMIGRSLSNLRLSK